MNGIYAQGVVTAHSQELGKRKDGTAYHVEKLAMSDTKSRTWFVTNYSDDLDNRPELPFGTKLIVSVEGCRTDDKRNLYLSGPYTVQK